MNQRRVFLKRIVGIVAAMMAVGRPKSLVATNAFEGADCIPINPRQERVVLRMGCGKTHAIAALLMAHRTERSNRLRNQACVQSAAIDFTQQGTGEATVNCSGTKKYRKYHVSGGRTF